MRWQALSTRRLGDISNGWEQKPCQLTFLLRRPRIVVFAARRRVSRLSFSSYAVVSQGSSVVSMEHLPAFALRVFGALDPLPALVPVLERVAAAIACREGI